MITSKYIPVRYTASVELARSPREVFYVLLHDVGRWWPEQLEGSSSKLHDEFVFRTGDSHYSKNKVIELVPDQKLVWLTLESRRNSDGFDWSGTKFIFELSQLDAGTKLQFTYEGPVLDQERERLAILCEMIVKEKIYDLLNSAS